MCKGKSARVSLEIGMQALLKVSVVVVVTVVRISMISVEGSALYVFAYVCMFQTK